MVPAEETRYLATFSFLLSTTHVPRSRASGTLLRPVQRQHTRTHHQMLAATPLPAVDSSPLIHPGLPCPCTNPPNAMLGSNGVGTLSCTGTNSSRVYHTQALVYYVHACTTPVPHPPFTAPAGSIPPPSSHSHAVQCFSSWSKCSTPCFPL